MASANISWRVASSTTQKLHRVPLSDVRNVRYTLIKPASWRLDTATETEWNTTLTDNKSRRKRPFEDPKFSSLQSILQSVNILTTADHLNETFHFYKYHLVLQHWLILETKKILLQHRREQNVVLTGRSVKAIPAEEETKSHFCFYAHQEATVSVFTGTEVIWLLSPLCSYLIFLIRHMNDKSFIWVR